jgi:hypothetical protein
LGICNPHAKRQENPMNPLRPPGNEPDPGDMSTDPGAPAPVDTPGEPMVPDEEAEQLGPLP